MQCLDLIDFIGRNEFVDDLWLNPNGVTIDVRVSFFTITVITEPHKTKGNHILLHRSEWFVYSFADYEELVNIAEDVRNRWKLKVYELINNVKAVRLIDVVGQGEWSMSHTALEQALTNSSIIEMSEI